MANDRNEVKPGQKTTQPKTVSPVGIFRIYNAALAALVFYQYITDPEASPREYWFDILLHAWQAIDPTLLREYAIAANGVRAAQAAYGFFHPEQSTIKQAFNGADILNHAVIVYQSAQ